MRIYVSPQSVPAGTVSFRVANTGSLVHALVSNLAGQYAAGMYVQLTVT